MQPGCKHEPTQTTLYMGQIVFNFIVKSSWDPRLSSSGPHKKSQPPQWKPLNYWLHRLAAFKHYKDVICKGHCTSQTSAFDLLITAIPTAIST